MFQAGQIVWKCWPALRSWPAFARRVRVSHVEAGIVWLTPCGSANGCYSAGTGRMVGSASNTFLSHELPAGYQDRGYAWQAAFQDFAIRLGKLLPREITIHGARWTPAALDRLAAQVAA